MKLIVVAPGVNVHLKFPSSSSPSCRIFCLQRENAEEVLYCCHPPASNPALDKAILEDYFRLDYSLSSLSHSWGEKDGNFLQKASTCYGVRLLNQQPLEALVAFISSSNNNIERIEKMMLKLCQAFGTHMGCHEQIDYFSFPTLAKLCALDVEDRLKELGFGYRARYIHQTAVKLSTELGGEEWLTELKKKKYSGT